MCKSKSNSKVLVWARGTSPLTVFNSHEIQMHTKVENRCADPFLQRLESTIGIDRVRALHFFYPSSTFNMDNVYSYAAVVLCVNRLCAVWQWFVLNSGASRRIWCKRRIWDCTDHASNIPLKIFRTWAFRTMIIEFRSLFQMHWPFDNKFVDYQFFIQSL